MKYRTIIITLILLLGVISLVPLQAQPRGSPRFPWPGFEGLKGRWQALAGEFVLQINKIDPLGRMEVQFINPQPVKVVKAQAARDGKEIRISIKLRDPGLPYLIYDLTYQTGLDQLQGVYWQKGNSKSTKVVFIKAQ